MITLGDIVDEARIALRHDLDARLNDVRFANRVGRRWVNAHPSGGWEYLAGRSTVITTVTDQQDYDLPLNWAQEQETLNYDGGVAPLQIVHDVRPGSWHASNRRNFGSYYGRFFGYVDHATQSDGKTFGPVLHLTPKPAESREILMVYRAGWTPLSGEDDVADVPTWAEEAFLDLVRTVALAAHRPPQEGHPDPIAAMMAVWASGLEFSKAVERDALIVPDIEHGLGAMEEVALLENRGRYIGPRFTNQDLLSDLG